MEVSDARARAQHWWLSCSVALLALTLLVLGGMHAVARGGVACAGETACGAWTMPGGDPGTLAALHRFVALGVGIGALALTAVAVARLRADRPVVLASLATLSLIATQALVTASPIRRGAPGPASAVHLGATALLLGVCIYLVLVPRLQDASWAARWRPVVSPGWIDLQHLTLAAMFGLLVTGSLVTTGPTAPECRTWPLCGAQLRSPTTIDVDIHLVHRLLAAASGVLIVAVVTHTLMTRRRSRLELIAALGLGATFFAEVAAGVLTTWRSAPEAIAGLHFAVAGVAWGMLCTLAIASGGRQSAGARVSIGELRATLRDYVRVTKPGIMLLLEITTLGAMLVAGSDWPSLGLIGATLLGGALASGGASALNCYLDRDIDIIMARTRRRPIPTGRLSPRQVRNLGLALSILSIVEMLWLVNVPATLLALGGNVFYVGIYTRLLKRSTPQNIVIGGAAGAFPPLVGWAAVTGSVDAGALILFAVIFLWTPPHFWSLALLKANDYRRAGIPMLPVTAGEHVTRRQILLYSLALFATTLLLVPAGVAGALYLGAAVLLGIGFVGYALRMYRERSARLAWPLFKYSNYYLAALLAMMVIDRSIGR